MKLSPCSASHRVIRIPCVEWIGHPQWTVNRIYTSVLEKSRIELPPGKRSNCILLRVPRCNSDGAPNVMTIEKSQSNTPLKSQIRTKPLGQKFDTMQKRSNLLGEGNLRKLQIRIVAHTDKCSPSLRLPLGLGV